MMFDGQPDGDPHGECAAEIHRLEAINAELLSACRMALMLRQLGGMMPGSREVVMSVVEAAEAALAKATGAPQP